MTGASLIAVNIGDDFSPFGVYFGGREIEIAGDVGIGVRVLMRPGLASVLVALLNLALMKAG